MLDKGREALIATLAPEAMGRPELVHRLGSVLAHAYADIRTPVTKSQERIMSGIAISDARHVSDGPVARAWLDQPLPLALHGEFTST